MSKDEKLGQFHIRYQGLYDFDGMYAAVTDWAKNYGYMWHEATYKHKVPSPKGAEQEMVWDMKKKVTVFIHFNILLQVRLDEMTEVEVDSGTGQKRLLTNGRIRMTITPKLTYDWQNKFKGSKFLDKLLEKYRNLTGVVDDVYIDQLYYRAWNLQALIKKYFDMQSKKYAYKGYLGED